MNQLSINQQKEVEKYIDVYTNGTTSTPGIYGHGNHGKDSYGYIKGLNINSILDVGCGQGNFVNHMQQILEIPNVYGLDIASVRTKNHIQNDKITWIDSQAHIIPLESNSIEYITSFDCLEHVLEEDVDNIVDEFFRVSTKGLILKIAYRQAIERTLNGDILHMTVQPEEWWIHKFEKKFTYNGKYNNTYLLFIKTA